MVKKLFNSLEYIFTISSLILYTGGIIGVVALDGLSEGEIDYNQVSNDTSRFFLVKFLYPFTYVIAFLILTKLPRKSTKISVILSQNIHILLIVGLTFFSTIWSELPSQTFSRSVALIGTTIFGIYLANRYSLKKQLLLLSHTFCAIIVLSIIFAIALPQYGVMEGIHAGAWRGIYTHKNEFGRLMSLSTIVLMMQCSPAAGITILNLRTRSIGRLQQYLPIEIRRTSLLQTLPMYLGLGLSIVLLVLARSSGAIVNLTVMTICLMIFKIGQLQFYQKFIARLGTITFFCIFAVILGPNPESLFTSIGKSSDLTGRGDLWNILFDLLSKSPLLGFGYGIFWEKYGAIVALEAGWNVPDAHNGFLDLTLSIGLLGLALFAISYFNTFTTGFARFCDRQSDEEIYPLILLIYIFIGNISETGLFTYNNIYWLLYVTVSYSVIASGKKNIVGLPKSSIFLTGKQKFLP